MQATDRCLALLHLQHWSPPTGCHERWTRQADWRQATGDSPRLGHCCSNPWNWSTAHRRKSSPQRTARRWNSVNDKSRNPTRPSLVRIAWSHADDVHCVCVLYRRESVASSSAERCRANYEAGYLGQPSQYCCNKPVPAQQQFQAGRTSTDLACPLANATVRCHQPHCSHRTTFVERDLDYLHSCAATTMAQTFLRTSIQQALWMGDSY